MADVGFPSGNFGVDLFFVLSGFLITRILLQGRQYVEEGSQSLSLTLRHFYIRRTLRIFPLYYAFLIGYAGISQSWVNDLTPWLWTFTLNLYRVFIDSDWGGPISHLWSLSVEEQFYFVWPWVILFTPRRLLLPVLVLFVILGPTTKTILALNEVSDRAIRFFTLSCLDTLALGGLLAYATKRHGIHAVAQSCAAKMLLWVGLPIFLMGIHLRTSDTSATWGQILELSGETLLCGWTVIMAAKGFQGVIGRVLASSPLVYLGRISFGLYLLHKPIPMMLEKFGLTLNELPLVVSFAIYTGLAILIASASWHAFEKPLNSLKRHFPYRAKENHLKSAS